MYMCVCARVRVRVCVSVLTHMCVRACRVHVCVCACVCVGVAHTGPLCSSLSQLVTKQYKISGNIWLIRPTVDGGNADFCFVTHSDLQNDLQNLALHSNIT